MIALLLAFNLLELWRDTNSHAANARGVDAFAHKRFAEAAADFGKQARINPSPAANFSLGTAQIAAGNREQGSSTIAKALRDPALRGDALFNRGNSALAAKAYDYAIRDYTAALKANSRDPAAKRNLEIALAQKSASQPQAGASRRNQEGSSPRPQPQQPQPTPDRDNRKSDPNAESLLRSVQQQEQEELSRMHRTRPERAHIGW
jgi:tetratricopeptide (TPR) repeat protein